MLLICNGLLFTMEKEAPERADLLIKDGKIAKIAPDIPPMTTRRSSTPQGCGSIRG